MADLIQAPSFQGGSIKTFSFFNFVNWANASFDDACDEPLRLPAMQRRALWAPKNILEFWDSLLRGMPIGMFYLVPSAGIGLTLDGSMSEAIKKGYDLLDGQQRTRTMLLAVRSSWKEGRCLWVDLGSDLLSGKALRLTTESQPFGYDAQGAKLALKDRLSARATYNAFVESLGEPNVGSVYNHDLYRRELARSAQGCHRPPMPAKLSGPAVPMCELVELWKTADSDRVRFKADLVELIGTTVDMSTNLDALCDAFHSLNVAEVALIRVEPPSLAVGAPGGDWLLRLFVRIGDGGVQLGPAERRYSIYKYHEPYVHELVSLIENDPDVGHVMPATAIVETALRIANAQKPAPAFGMINADLFAKEMADTTSSFRDELHKLLPVSDTSVGKGGALIVAFRAVFQLLTYTVDNPNGLPKAQIVGLRPELIQILVYWAVLAHPLDADSSTAADMDITRSEIIRFALFWQLYCLKEEQGARRAFQFLQKLYTGGDTTVGSTGFPGRSLYRALLISDDEHGPVCALRLVPLAVIKAYATLPATSQWRSNEERFRSVVPNLESSETAAAKEIYKKWWESDQILLWLQRCYLSTKFVSYNPTSDRDDDKPYDLDHIQPQANWNFNGNQKIPTQGEDGSTESYYSPDFYSGRSALGNGIGNKRWIDSSENRSWGATDHVLKLGLDRFMNHDSSTEPDEWMGSAFDIKDPSSIKLWADAGADESRRSRWTKFRMQAFQQAVESRAFWLYEQFWNSNSFSVWLEDEPEV